MEFEEDVIIHFGVKGMKWGQRRREKKALRESNTKAAREAGYHPNSRENDRKNLGEGGARRIETRIVSGQKVGKARASEYANSVARGAATVAVIAGGYTAFHMTNKGLAKWATSTSAKRAAKAAADILSKEKGIGAHRIVALTFDATKNAWG